MDKGASKLTIGLVLVLLIGAGGIFLFQNQPGELEPPEVEPKECFSDQDCAVFGEDGQCNCGCFNQNYAWEERGECFCSAPDSCECVNGECKNVFEEQLAQNQPSNSEIQYQTITDSVSIEGSVVGLLSVDYPSLWIPTSSEQMMGIFSNPNVFWAQKGRSPDWCFQGIERHSALTEETGLELYGQTIESLMERAGSVTHLEKKIIHGKHLWRYEYLDTENIRASLWYILFNCGNYDYLIYFSCSGKELGKELPDISEHIISSISCQLQ
ncbi:MAG: hypothetical protein GF370_04765 [Candidatus Nealsonbacteria bacterium]|nr:hypothetical protein [Candidatus Nealsonbacteria bacterium]